MKQTISVLVENQAGVLNRITGLFSRRAFNIESLAVGVTDDPTVSRITIIVDSGNSVVEQVEKQLNKLIEVIKVRTLEDTSYIGRELMILKVNANNKTRQDIIEILLQMPFSFLFSTFIDFNMMMTSELRPTNYGMSIALLLTGCLVQSIGVVLELKPKVAMMSAEAFVKYASRRYNKEFGKFKVYFDVTLVTLAVILSLLLTQGVQGVREGSLIAACITGYIVSFLNQKIMTRKTLHKLLPVLK